MKKILIRTLMLFSLMLFTACQKDKLFSSNKVIVKEMSGEDLQEIQEDKKKKEEVLVIDVRRKEEYEKGHLAHAINIALEEFKENVERIENFKDKPVILYCNTGRRSREAANILIAEGFKDVTNATGLKEYDYKLKTYNNMLGQDLLAKKDSAFLVDVREEEDFNKAHFTNAINVSISDLSKLDSLLPEDKDTLILTYCYSGNRSAKAAEYIREKGYTNVWSSLDGTKEMEFKFE